MKTPEIEFSCKIKFNNVYGEEFTFSSNILNQNQIDQINEIVHYIVENKGGEFEHSTNPTAEAVGVRKKVNNTLGGKIK